MIATSADISSLSIDTIQLIMSKLSFRDSLALASLQKWESEVNNPLDRSKTNPLLYHDARTDDQVALFNLVRFSTSPNIVTHLKKLLQNPTVDPTINDNQVFIEACTRRKIDLVRVLLQDPRIDISSQNNLAIQMASVGSSTELFTLLLEHLKINEDFINAAKDGDLDKINILLTKSNIRPSIKNNLPLLLSFRNGHFEVFKRILQDPRIMFSAPKNLLLTEVVKSGHVDMLNSLLKCKGINPGSNECDFLEAVSSGNLRIINRLLEDPRVDPSVKRNHAVYLAAKTRNLDLLERLLEDHRVDPSDFNNIALFKASNQGFSEIVQKLLENQKVLNGSLSASLHCAELQRNQDIFQLLFQAKKKQSQIIWNERYNSLKNMIPFLRKS